MFAEVDLAAIAREHLPGDVAERWIRLLQPAIQLDAYARECDTTVGYMGGEPELPSDVAWPVWPGEGPLNFVAAIDCSSLPRLPEFPLPASGTLLFFYYDRAFPKRSALVLFTDPQSQAGARVIYVPPETPTTLRPTPDGLIAYRQVPLRAAVVSTAPSYEHLAVHEAFPEMGQEGVDHPVCGDEFVDALDLPYHFGHQLGGYALPIQGPVEFEVAHAALGAVDWRSPELPVEAARWRLLAQFTSNHHSGMMWGKAGTLYWLLKPEDLVAGRFDRALFTWQC